MFAIIFKLFQLEGAVVKVCELQVSPLVAIMDAPRAPKLVKNSPNDPVLYLDRLADVFRHVSPSNGCVISAPHPCKGVVEATWPALSRCCDLYADDERITERTCRTIRYNLIKFSNNKIEIGKYILTLSLSSIFYKHIYQSLCTRS